MQEVSFDPRYLDWVRSGRKTRTTRYAEAVAAGPARFRFESTPPVWLDAGELRAALRYHYPA